MADRSDQPGPSSETCENTSAVDEKFDLYSEKFDPLSFLLSSGHQIPKPNAKIYDNIAKWHSHYTRGANSSKTGKKADKTEMPKRRWLPHQLPVESQRSSRTKKNLFTKMENIQGPLAVLRKYITEKTRIKIITRNEKGVRGYCMAYLLAFDKHFNLVLDKVDEVWYRSIKVNKSPLFIDAGSENVKKSSYKRPKIPKIESTKVSKNTEECKRHVNQMLIRGEHVVLICVPKVEKSQ